ncbi:glycoside hydrolase family protein [Rugamonas sp. DEMB1]|uniref:glycoside hydrolase family protein n=1 Tax=Rugamonas sp. DEMB1 TaxID=3039386 RepID=UPI00244CC00F|nr:glycoside hydrolase family protein [Rugamonas sp. DEMB1]WGG50401.1 glycoside hydrolase family protein [Rugamonas sp. DEMB1]
MSVFLATAIIDLSGVAEIATYQQIWWSCWLAISPPCDCKARHLAKTHFEKHRACYGEFCYFPASFRYVNLENPMATSPAPANPNAALRMSTEARNRMRSPQREATIRGYYNDGRGGRGHCTYGIGILAHRGPCTAEELRRPLTATQIEASFDAAVREAERAVRQNVRRQALTQAQFDALVSYTYNTGARGAYDTFQHVDRGDFAGAADIISGNTYSRQGRRRVFMPGLVPRRREESAPFRETR